MVEPEQNRDLGALSPLVLYPFLAWRDSVLDVVRHIDIGVHETRRSQARQDWLWAQGRLPPYLDADRVTWTRQSLHQWGLAVDWHFVRKADPGVAVWEPDSYRWIYAQVPPEVFGLTTLPGDVVHLESVLATEAIEKADVLGLWLS